MNVILYGASGNVGSRLLKELLARGHHVTAAVRNPSKVQAGITAKQDDLSNVDQTVKIIKGSDAVISAYAPPLDDLDAIVGVTQRQIEAVKKAGVPRWLQAYHLLRPDICRRLTWKSPRPTSKR
jgi:putative NADH-flavin reductase